MQNAFLGAKTLFLDLIFPKFCVRCRTEGAFLCEKCAQNLTVLAPRCIICGRRTLNGAVCRPCRKKTPLTRVFASFSYTDAVARDLIHLFKYNGAKELSEVLSGSLARHLAHYAFNPPKNAIAIPMPLHKKRERERGFNQALLLAENLCRYFPLSLHKDILLRTKPTLPQIEMKNNEERAKNIYGAFTIRRPEMVLRKTVILIDDVITSGATMNEAAQILKTAGARSVWAVALARRN